MPGQEDLMPKSINAIARAVGYSPRHLRRLMAEGKVRIASRPHPTAHWRLRPAAVRHLLATASVH